MTKAPDVGFPFWSPNSIRTLALGEVLDELRASEARRRDGYPRKVDAGRMKPDDAAREIEMMAQLVAEFTYLHTWPDAGDAARADARFTWAEKVNCLRREIMIRRNDMPRRVEQGRMTIEDAERHIAAMEAAHAFYWYQGLDFILPWQTGQDSAPLMAAIRAERDRRSGWARAHHIDPDTGPGAYTGDWSTHRTFEEQAA